MRTRAIYFTGVGSVEVGEAEVPEPGEGEVLLETIYSCVSPGTELRCLSGRQADAPPWPFIPGYALVGRVRATGPGVSLAEGTVMFAGGSEKVTGNRLWGGHIAHAVTAASKVFVIPAETDPREAALAKLAAITMRGLRMSCPQPWETVAVVGLGPIGHLAARLHAVSGARVVGVDTVPERAYALQRAGIEAVVATPDTLAASVRALLPGGADIVVDSTGVSAAARQAVRLAREPDWSDASVGTGSRYLVQGSYPDDVSLPYDDFFRREITLLFARDNRPGDIRQVFDLLARKRLSLDGILGEPFAPEDAARVYAALQDRTADRLTAVFRWS